MVCQGTLYLESTNSQTMLMTGITVMYTVLLSITNKKPPNNILKFLKICGITLNFINIQVYVAYYLLINSFLLNECPDLSNSFVAQWFVCNELLYGMSSIIFLLYLGMYYIDISGMRDVKNTILVFFFDNNRSSNFLIIFSLVCTILMLLVLLICALLISFL